MRERKREREREGEKSDKRYQMTKNLDGNNKGVNNLNVILLRPISSKFNQNVLFFFDGGKKLNLESSFTQSCSIEVEPK